MKNTDLLIFSGQSNMQGQTECFPGNNVIKNAFEYTMVDNALKPLKHPVGENINLKGEKGKGDITDTLLGAWQGFGCMVPSFCKKYSETAKIKTVAVHIAKGSTTIAEWFPETDRYKIAVKKVQNAIKKVNSEYNIKHIFFIWLQGESDAIESKQKNYYEDNLTIFKNNLKKDLNIDKFFIIRVGRFTNDDRDFEIIKAQEEICKKDNDFVLLTRITGYLLQDEKYINPFAKGHYNNAGQNAIGDVAGKNAALFALNISFSLEKEPFKEIT